LHGRWNGCEDIKLESCKPFRDFRDLAAFPIELGLVAQVLVLATAATSEKGAERFHTLGGGFEDFNEIGLRAIGFIPVDAGFDGFAGEGERNEDNPRAFLLVLIVFARSHRNASHAEAEVGEGLNGESQLMMIGEGVVPEFARRTHGES
jgi:hypothetical protein